MPASLPAILIAIALFGFMATAVQPTVNASDQARLDTSAQQLASLLRIAQAQSIRSGSPHGVMYNSIEQAFTVVQADLSNNPFTAASPTYHPIYKTPLTWRADAWISLTPNDGVFNYGVHGVANQLLFDSWGTPILPTNSGNQQLAATSLSLATTNASKTITIEAMNGRVRVQ